MILILTQASLVAQVVAKAAAGLPGGARWAVLTRPYRRSREQGNFAAMLSDCMALDDGGNRLLIVQIPDQCLYRAHADGRRTRTGTWQMPGTADSPAVTWRTLWAPVRAAAFKLQPGWLPQAWQCNPDPGPLQIE
jgi:hypothetical protein